MLLEGKTAVVTGGSRGIGRAIVERFLCEGATLACWATKSGPYQDELAQLAASQPGTVHFYHADVGDPEQVEATLGRIVQDLGQVDVLVNNAGITRDGLLFGMKVEQWREVLRVNLDSAFYICKIVARHMALRKTGSIINMSSVVGLMGNGGQANYAAAKAGLIGFSLSLAREVASRGVKVNVIAPGYVQTDMTDKLNEKQKQRVLQQVPFGRIGRPAEIAAAALFLASDLSSYVTGQTLAVDGGITMG